MKTITKTFYVNDIYLEAIKSNFDRSIVIRHKDETEITGISCHATNKIQISWQEPEKKIEITESEFENILESLKEKTQWRSYLDIIEKELKQKLFGASDE